MSMIFALVLMGCADDGTACERLSAPSDHYVSKVACEAGQETALQSPTALRADYPTVVSRCLRLNGAQAMAGRGASPRG
jgi:hypothetical protein